MSRLREVAAQVSNWGRWGPEDELGTINFVTDDVVRKAAACVRRGAVFSLGLRFDSEGPQIGQQGRVNPTHVMNATDGKLNDDPLGFHFADDSLSLPLQCATQWDSLAHAWYDGKLYNGHSAATITAAGAARNGIDKLAARGIVTRGVLLDLARAKGVKRLAPGATIGPADLEAAERRQGVRVESGDALLLRTGHLAVFKRDGDRIGYMKQEPGIGIDTVPWLHAREIAALAADTMAIEVIPFADPADPLPVHRLCIRDMGLTLGEMFDLDELAEDCARDGVWTFLLSAPPLKVTGGVGSPLNPLAVK